MANKSAPHFSSFSNFRFMLRQAWRTYPSVVIFCLVLGFLSAGLTIAQLFATPVLLRELETGAPLASLLTVIGLYVLLLMVLRGLREYIGDVTGYGRIGVRISIVRDMDMKFAETSYPNTLDDKFLKASQRAMQACNSNETASECFWDTLQKLVANVVGFAAYLTLLSGLNPVLMAVVLVTSAAGFIINQRLNSWGFRHREEESDARKPMFAVQRIAKDQAYAKDIRLFGLRNWLDDIWNSGNRLLTIFLRRRETRYLFVSVVDLVMTLLRNGVAYYVLISLTLTQNLPVSQFLLYFSAVGGFSSWVTGILDQCAMLHKQSLDISTIREYLEWPEQFRFSGGKALAYQPGDPCEIRLDDVSFRYPEADHDTISHMSLTLHNGEKLAIVGLNGAGKTTLVKLLCGFLDPTDGRVLFNGQDIRELNRPDYYALFSAVFQDFSVLDCELETNVAQSMTDIDEDKVRRCLDLAGLTEKVNSLPDGLHTHIGRDVFLDGVNLSGGETQRLMLARALYKDGPILALDEPTAALDPIAEDDIYHKYAAMTEGKTSIFISHRLASTRFCDRIVFLADGKIAEEGTHEELLSRGGGYADLFEVQSHYYRETPEGGESHV